MLTHTMTLASPDGDTLLNILHDDNTGDEVVIDLEELTALNYPDWVYEHISLLNRGYTLWEVIDETETYDYLHDMHEDGYIDDSAWDNIKKYDWHIATELYD